MCIDLFCDLHTKGSVFMKAKAKEIISILKVTAKNFLRYIAILVTIGAIIGGIVIGMIYMVGKTGASVKVGNAEISAPAKK